MGENIVAYCSDCQKSQRKKRKSFASEDNMPKFCEDCGSELEMLSEGEYEEKESKKENWPIEVKIEIPIRMNDDYYHDIISQTDLETFPFDCNESYYIDERLGSIPIKIEIAKDGSYKISESHSF